MRKINTSLVLTFTHTIRFVKYSTKSITVYVLNTLSVYDITLFSRMIRTAAIMALSNNIRRFTIT